jgi:hypothetical protein
MSDLLITLRQKNTNNYYPNIIGQLQRYYVDENTWRTVQMDKSGDYGLLTYNIVENTVDYRLQFLDSNNNVLNRSNSLKFSCTGGVCDLTWLLSPYTSSVISPALVYYWLYDNNSNLINTTWDDNLGLTHTFRTKISKPTTSSERFTICDTTGTGTSGMISCDVTGYQGSVYLEVFSSASPNRTVTSVWLELVRTKLVDISDLPEEEFNILAIFILLPVFVLGLVRPAMAVIMPLFGMVMVYTLGMFSVLTMSALIVVGIMAMFVGVLVRK